MVDPFLELGPIQSSVELPPLPKDRRFKKRGMHPMDSVQPKVKRKKTDLNPFQKKWFEDNGYTWARVEHSNAFGAVTVDLWGFADYLACKPGDIVLVQTSSHANASARIKKAKATKELWAWLASGGRYEFHGWRQPNGPRTKWEVVIQEVRAV